jgi:uncharacterized membrane protein
MTIASVFLLLTIYSVAGWVMEVVYVSLDQRRLVDRGFLYGPLCPIYGVGCMLIGHYLKPLNGNLLLLFAAASALTTALEYSTSWVLEKMFSTTWWDYSKNRFNLNGRICLQNSIAFGAMGILIAAFVHPFLLSTLSRVSPRVQQAAALSIFAVGLVDLFFTLRDLIDLDGKIRDLKVFLDTHILQTDQNEWFDAHDLKRSYARLKSLSAGNSVEVYNERLTHLEKVLRRSSGMRRLFRSFPGLRNRKHNFALDTFSHYRNRPTLAPSPLNPARTENTGN